MKNIWVWHAMRSLVPRGHVKHQFSWQWNYYMLTNEGIEVKMELVSFDSVYNLRYEFNNNYVQSMKRPVASTHNLAQDLPFSRHRRGRVQ